MIDKDDVLAFQNLVNKIYIDEKLLEYITHIVNASRNPKEYGISNDWISFGASPRASIYLALAGKGHALIQGRGYVLPEDIKSIAQDVLRHRIILSYEAEAEEKTPEELIDQILSLIPVP